MTTELRTTSAELPQKLRPAMEGMARVAADLAEQIALGPRGGKLGEAVGQNTDGDSQKALDVMADVAFTAAARGSGIRYYASEERDQVEILDPEGSLALAIDPLDGSSNIDVNVSIGTIFALTEAGADPDETFLSSGRDLLAAGYFIYGPATILMVTFGDGVRQFVLDRMEHAFIEVPAPAPIPQLTKEFAINASNYRHWAAPVRSFIDDYLSGENGPHAQNFNMRWVASLVAETHRILTRGGVFLYPGDARDGYGDGRLRMVYECQPIAFLVEQSGGRATTGTDRLLDKTPASLHARSPFVFGSSGNVDRLTVYHDLPDTEVSALFGERGLFRA